MPQHPTWHNAPAHHRGRLIDTELERLLPCDPDRLTNLYAFAGARMLVRQFQHDGLAPVAPRDSVGRATYHFYVEGEFGLSLSQAGDRSPGR